jgi:non-specific serine/threonine protein kinase
MLTGPPATFGELLRYHRHAAGLTQSELAERAGLSVHGVQKLEHDVTRPYRDTVQRLVVALDLSGEDRVRFEAAGAPVPRRQAPFNGPGSDAARHNLPLETTSFLGRQQELMEVKRQLAEARLLTLTGVGGCGKTRLALELGRQVVDRYPNGVWLIELGPLAEPDLVAHSVATAVGVREVAGQPIVEALTVALRQRRLLLVLDNCEHVLDACAELVHAVLRTCSDVQVLATSREPLGIPGEVAWRVPSLPTPDPRRLPNLAVLEQNPAVCLFIERARAGERSFILTERNALAVAQVCRRLDGIPLALELAAARVRALTVEQLASRLDQRFRLLTGGSRTALPRQQTLQATLDWSYELLSLLDRQLFNRIGVFAGGWSLEAAEAVGAGDGLAQEGVLDGLARLVEKSLVLAEGGPDGAQHYHLLETIRQYARERLLAAGEAEATRKRHAEYFLALGDALVRGAMFPLAPMLPEQAVFDQLEREQDNTRAALRWWVETGDAERAVRQARALYPIWFFRGLLTEGLDWLQELQGLPDASNMSTVRLQLLELLAHVARRHGDFPAAEAAFRELLVLQRGAGDQLGSAATLAHQANLHYLLADYATAWTLLEESQTMARDRLETTDASTQANFRFMWPFVGGQIALHEGRYELARTLFSEALDKTDRSSEGLETAYVLMNLGTAAREQGFHDEAHGFLQGGLRIAWTHGDKTLLARSLEGCSGLASALGQHERALRIGAAAAALQAVIGAPLGPAWGRMVDRWLVVSRAALSEAAASAAWSQGYALTLDIAVAEASAEGERSATPARGETRHRASLPLATRHRASTRRGCEL